MECRGPRQSDRNNELPQPARSESEKIISVTPGENSLVQGVIEAVSELQQLAFPGSKAAPRVLSIKEIEKRFAEHNFPEMEKLWRKARALKLDPAQLNEDIIQSRRRDHMTPLGRRILPALGVCALGIGSALAAAYSFASDDILGIALTQPFGISTYNIDLQTKIAPYLAKLFIAINSTAIGASILWISSELRRRYISPVNSIMAEDLTFMLSRENYREHLEHTTRGQAFTKRKTEFGLTKVWDNPYYRLRFSGKKAGYEELPQEQITDPLQYIETTLRDFLGQVVDRKFKPGRYTPYLQEGKKTISAFTNFHKESFAALRSRTISLNDAVRMLQDLREVVKPDGPGLRVLENACNNLKHQSVLKPREIQVEVWKRDPLYDLTAQDEFYSSASLRGKKLMGSISRGMLGTFGYVANPCISALDFRNNKRRLVRARLAAATTKNAKGELVSVLWVDGVEGSNSVQPAFIEAQIERYARDCHFDCIAYNKRLHNHVPRRFIKHIKNTGLRECCFDLEYMSSEQREYLDGLGISMDPLEYTRPRGRVIGYIKDLNEHRRGPEGKVSRWDKAVTWSKHNAYNIFTVGLSASMASIFSYKFGIYGLVALLVPPFSYLNQHLYLSRSMRDTAGADSSKDHELDTRAPDQS